MEGDIAISAAVVWSALGGAGTIITTLAVTIYRIITANAAAMLELNLKQIEASNGNTNALNRMTDILDRINEMLNRSGKS